MKMRQGITVIRQVNIIIIILSVMVLKTQFSFVIIFTPQKPAMTALQAVTILVAMVSRKKVW